MHVPCLKCRHQKTKLTELGAFPLAIASGQKKTLLFASSKHRLWFNLSAWFSQSKIGKDDKSRNNFSWKRPVDTSIPSPCSRQSWLQNQIQVLRALSSSEHLQANILLSPSPSQPSLEDLPSPGGGQLAWGTPLAPSHHLWVEAERRGGAG